MRKTIDAWLEYIQSLHAREIDLSLDRVNDVFQRLRPQGVSFKVVTVAGTNGKGSTCELLASIYSAAGYQTGRYTSPHVINFNERFELNRQVVEDTKLIEVLQRVETARNQTALTFFEFGTLVAIELFADQGVDVAIMEVGLGGRLDAVNILAADVAVVTSISIDHVDWLGDSIEKIALEKIAITRPDHPCILGMRDPPKAILDYCQSNNVLFSQLGKDFDYKNNNENWCWRTQSQEISLLSRPFQQVGVQLDNAAAAIMAVQQLQKTLSVNDLEVRQGIANARLLARCQIVSRQPTIVVDVAHNQASISELADFVKNLKISGKVFALCGMLKDKQIEASLAPLIDLVDEWDLVNIESSRGSKAESISKILGKLSSEADSFCFENVQGAYDHVFAEIKIDDVLLVFGSFFIVGDIMPLLNINEAKIDYDQYSHRPLNC